MSFLISNANAQAAGSGSMSDPLFTLLLLLLFAVVFYFLLIRPQSKRQKEHKRMVDGLTKGDEVLTVGGIAGRVTDFGYNFVLVEIAEGTQVKVRRAAVDAVLPKGSLKDL